MKKLFFMGLGILISLFILSKFAFSEAVPAGLKAEAHVKIVEKDGNQS